MMEKYQEDTYGEHVAGTYDEWYAKDDEAMIETHAELAGGGRTLELGIGTGRVALPLQQKGIAVDGIDASPTAEVTLDYQIKDTNPMINLAVLRDQLITQVTR